MTKDELFDVSWPELSGDDAFALYESVRDLAPKASFPEKLQQVDNLVEVADAVDVYVFDAFGVLNIGMGPIEGASERVRELREMGKKVFVLSNGASYDADANVEKFSGFGFDFSREEIVSSRDATVEALNSPTNSIHWGAAAKQDFKPSEFAQSMVKLEDDPQTYEAVEGFLLLSVLDWNRERQEMLEDAISMRARPIIIANPDIVSPWGECFSLEPGYLGYRLAKHFGAQVQFLGKPYGSVFDLVQARIDKNIPRNRVCMVGDTLHTDILGGAAMGWRTALVSGHGLFKGLDYPAYVDRSKIVPDWVVESI